MLQSLRSFRSLQFLFHVDCSSSTVNQIVVMETTSNLKLMWEWKVGKAVFFWIYCKYFRRIWRLCWRRVWIQNNYIIDRSTIFQSLNRRWNHNQLHFLSECRVESSLTNMYRGQKVASILQKIFDVPNSWIEDKSKMINFSKYLFNFFMRQFLLRNYFVYDVIGEFTMTTFQVILACPLH